MHLRNSYFIFGIIVRKSQYRRVYEICNKYIAIREGVIE